jgi:lactate permease
MALLWLFSASPVLLVVLCMTVFRWSAARAGLLGLAAAMTVAALSFGAGIDVQRVALTRGVLMALDVLPIVWGAYLFYRVTDEAGAIAALAEALPALTPSRGMQALVIGWAFTSLLQGVGGFGVPVAVTAPILVGLGFSPVTAVLVPSIGHAWAVTFGSLASAFQAMVTATGLTPSALAPASALALGVVGLACGVVATQAATGWKETGRLGLAILAIGIAMGASHYLLATHGLWPVASVGGGLAGMGVGLAVARRVGMGPARPLPAEAVRGFGRGLQGYAVLIGVISVVQFVAPLRDALHSWTVSVRLPSTETLHGFVMPEAAYRYAPLGHMGALLVYAAILVFLLYAWRGRALGRESLRRIIVGTARPMIPATLGILGMVALAAVMDYSGMIRVLAEAMAVLAGGGFALVSPWIGALGAFVTGSNTNSNLMFSALQLRTASLLGMDGPSILALQNIGGALGSVISPAKVIVAVSTVGLAGQEGRVMRPLAWGLGIILLLTSLAAGLGLLFAVVQSA